METQKFSACYRPNNQIQVALVIENPPCNAGDLKRCGFNLSQEDPLDEGMATHSVSCLEDPMDRGAWQATVQGVTESHTHRK